MAETKKHAYDESKIKTLSSLEHIRLRTGMYIGRIGDGSHYDDGCYILLKEVIDNAIDEFIMGHGKEVRINIQDKSVTVRDFGRGIPLGKVVDCVSKINTGAKYNDDVFQFSVGLNGVGTKAVNALSKTFLVRSQREGEFVEAAFTQGKLKKEKKGKTKDLDGTFIQFEPDPAIFPKTEFKPEFVERRLRHYSYLNTGLKLVFNGNTFQSRHGLLDLVMADLQADNAEPIYPPLHYTSKTLEFCFTHTNSRYGETFFSFVNGQYTTDGGTHISAFREELLHFLNRNPEVARTILAKVDDTKQLRKELQEVKKLARERARTVTLRIPQLKDCKIHFDKAKGKGKGSMVFITEGQSAAGSIVSCREVNTQAIFVLKGKPLNVWDLKRDIVYKNDELYNLMCALDIEDNLERLRYEKVILATDADVDGLHIRNLMITYFFKFFEQVVHDGHLFVLETPLFRARNKEQTVYCYSETERNEATAKLGAHCEITRFKGLGEISPAEFKQFIGQAMRLSQVEYAPKPDAANILSFYMGKNTPERKDYIMENLVVPVQD